MEDPQHLFEDLSWHAWENPKIVQRDWGQNHLWACMEKRIKRHQNSRLHEKVGIQRQFLRKESAKDLALQLLFRESTSIKRINHCWALLDAQYSRWDSRDYLERDQVHAKLWTIAVDEQTPRSTCHVHNLLCSQDKWLEVDYIQHDHQQLRPSFPKQRVCHSDLHLVRSKLRDRWDQRYHQLLQWSLLEVDEALYSTLQGVGESCQEGANSRSIGCWQEHYRHPCSHSIRHQTFHQGILSNNSSKRELPVEKCSDENYLLEG